MSTEEFNELLEHFNRNLEYYKNPRNNYNEDSCRLEYIDKLLLFLGWDVQNNNNLPPQFREVIVEQYNEDMNRPDYTMTYRGITKFFVEAKKPSVDIVNSMSAILQARRYGWNANHHVTVLTNFEYVLIFDTSIVPEETDNINTGLIKKIHFLDFVNRIDEMGMFISKDVVYSGDYDESFSNGLIESDREKIRVDKHFLNTLNKWRVDLGNELILRDEIYNDLFYLNDSIQRFINKLIFIRICEDRNLERYHFLFDTVNESEDLINELNQLFIEADLRYNSGLFVGNEIAFDLSSDSIMRIVSELYFPKSPYLFNIIEPNLLGKIYELYLTERLTLTECGLVLEKKKENRNRSVVSTPHEIVRYMTEISLDKLISDKSPDEIINMKFSDIACGSGVYLVEVYDQISNYFIDWYINHDISRLETNSSGDYKLPITIKKAILINCIYGFDIDLQAVEVTKFSLLTKLIEGESSDSIERNLPVLPELTNNVLCGNSLVSESDISGLDLSDGELYEILPFNWNDFFEQNGKFDLIIGNPPYVKTEDLHQLIPNIEFEIYKEKYRSAFKQFDKYFLFVEQSYHYINDSGILCYIIPNKFMKVDSGKKLRGLISNLNNENTVYDFGDRQLFSDKTIYSSILMLKKSGNSQTDYVSVESLSKLITSHFDYQIVKNNDQLGENIWSFKADRILENIENDIKPLTDYVDIFNGIQTSAERPVPIYWFTMDEVIGEDERSYTIERDSRRFVIEKAILKKYFKPASREEKGLNSYSLLKTNKFIIFPYDGEGRLISEERMISDFPGTYSYLRYYYNRLVPKQVNPEIGVRDVPTSSDNTWFQYGRTQALTSFINKNKLIVGILSKEPMYIYDDEDYLISSGGTAGYCAISLLSECPYSLEYIQAWLTAPITEEIIRDLGSPFEGGFISRGTSVLKKIGIYPLDLDDPSDRRVHDDITSKVRTIRSINVDLTRTPNRRRLLVLNQNKERLIREVNSMIFDIYSRQGEVA